MLPRWAKGSLAVVAAIVARWFVGNYLWQLLVGAGGGTALTALLAPITELEGSRLYLFGFGLSLFLMGAILYGTRFLPEPPLPPHEKEALSRVRVDEENLRQSVPPWRGELEHNRGVLETALEEGVYWNYADGERLESDQWNNRKFNNIKPDTEEKKTFWLAMERTHREFDRLNRKAIKAAESPIDLTLPDGAVAPALELLALAEAELEAVW